MLIRAGFFKNLLRFRRMQFTQGKIMHFSFDTDTRPCQRKYLLRFLKSMQPGKLTVFCKGPHSSGKTFRSAYRLALLSGSVFSWYRSTYLSKTQDVQSIRQACLHGISIGCRYGARTFTTLVESQSEASSPDIYKHDIIKLDDEMLRRAIAYEAEQGFPNCMGRSTRFGDFLSRKLFALSCAHSSQGEITLVALSNCAKTYDEMSNHDRISLLNKVSGLLGFHCVQDLIDHQAALSEASQDLHINSEDTKGLVSPISQGKVNATAQSKMTIRKESGASILQNVSHPCIVLGSSERIELYNSTEGGKDNLRLPPVIDSSEVCQTSRTSEQAVPMEVSSTELPDLYKEAGCDGDELVSKSQLQAKKVPKKTEKAPAWLQNLDTERIRATQPKKERKAAKKGDVSDTYDSWLLNKPIALVKSLSPSQCSRLDEHGFHTLRKLLQHYPRTYLNFQQAGQTVVDGQYLTFFGRIISSRGRVGASLGILEILIESAVDQHPGAADQISPDGNQNDAGTKRIVILHVKKFFRGARFANQWFLGKMTANYPYGAHAAVSGKVKAMDQEDHFEVKDFNVELYECKDEMGPEATKEKEKPYPVYPTKAGLDAKTIEFCLQKVLPDLPLDIDPLPEKVRMKNELMELREAYLGIHSPTSLEVAEKARQRFVFDEFFYLQLGLLLQRQQLADDYLEAAGIAKQQEEGSLDMENWSPLTLKLLQSLPYRLTNSQIKAASEIMWDLQRPVPMSRLLQGDVGCGKTVVAFLALLEVIDAGFQGALMGPTEFLAKQHYQRFVSWLELLDQKDRPQVALLTSSVPASKARAIRKGLETGEIQLAVGTHSLIADSVKFAGLGLAVIDEQHRFGVAQRIRLNNKGVVMNAGEHSKGSMESRSSSNEENNTKTVNMKAPHVLAMSATPIPRTLAFAIHGDMALSQITELPPGRTPTKTYAFMGDRDGLRVTFEMVRNDLKKGGRVFMVYPIIEESEVLPNLKAATVEYESLTKEFDGYTCGLVHGKLKSHEKEEAMRSFKSGETQVLVSTTVIEVGIDIPEASMIVVVNAERYGLAQLHQLRGRVGRGARESSCVLLASSATSLERLKILEETRDGFYLAEIDLRSRGPGDLLGKQQSGHLPEFSVARLEEDGDMMNQARIAAEEILSEYRGLEGLSRLKQELSFRRAPNSLGL